MDEYIIVEYPERRKVLINDEENGFNKDEEGISRILIVNSGQHTIRLDGNNDYSPLEQTMEVRNTSQLSPLHIKFTPQRTNDN